MSGQSIPRHYRWQLAPANPLLAGQLARTLHIAPLLAQCLLNRGFSEPDQISGFLEPRLKHLADPFLLPDMAAAVDRLFRAREHKEPLVIFGDYDVDGVTSTALLLEVLGGLGWAVHHYVPHRMDEGYGLSHDAAGNCLNKFPATLIVAVDCGSTSTDTIAWLRQRGVDVIVLDHHQVASPKPGAVALVNPRAAVKACGHLPSDAQDPEPPFAELCSVGLAFKLAHALVKRGREMGLPQAMDFDVRPLLDLVALGSIADIVPLTGENRVLVSAGLARLNVTQRSGLVALRKVAGAEGTLGTYEVGFQLGPRLNAAGRLETAEDALQLLLARDPAVAMPIAERLDRRNRERQKIERDIVDQVLTKLRNTFKPDSDFVIVEGQLPWHVGVVGIVASRVLNQFYRPTIIIGGDGAEWRGSGRSIPGFDLAAALRECGDLLVRHGGHAMAAGLTVHSDKLDALRQRLNELASRALTPESLQPPLRLDADVGLDELNLEQLRQLSRLHPTGQGNPAIQFCAHNLAQQRPLQRMGADKQHVKMWVTDGSTTHEAVWWGAGSGSLPVGRFDLAFAPQVNCYNDQKRVQLKVLDWKPTT